MTGMSSRLNGAANVEIDRDELLLSGPGQLAEVPAPCRGF
jgi:hypothetical protein